jgi:hypothetical protein
MILVVLFGAIRASWVVTGIFSFLDLECLLLASGYTHVLKAANSIGLVESFLC